MITSGVSFSRPEKKEVNGLIEKVFRGVLAQPLRLVLSPETHGNVLDY
ncbi:MAG: hypothetical protein ACE5JU_14185 [Candidatus Binatia bacterium]